MKNIDLNNLIDELNLAQRLEKNIFNHLFNSSSDNNKIDYNEIYHSNQQIFYSSLWCWYKLDDVISPDFSWSPTESIYLRKLQSYLRKLINTSKLLPAITYLFWQHSLEKCSEHDFRQKLSILFPSYANAHFQTISALKNIRNNE